MSISISRKTAFRNLIRIYRDKAYSSEILGATAAQISESDRNLIHKLTLGVLRNQIPIDSVINEYSSKRTDKMDIEVLILLRIGAYQLLFLERVPDYSAINESVELTRYARKHSAAGFVNAVLRKIANNRVDILLGLERARLPVSSSHPKWMLDKWRKAFGDSKAASIAMANNLEPAAAFRFTCAFDKLDKPEKASIEALVAKVEGLKSSEIAASGFVVDRNGETTRELAKRGLLYFQDEASQLVAEVVNGLAGKRVFDMCAAPGSKATLIARKSGIEFLVASDFYIHRAKSLFSNAASQKAYVQVICADALSALPFEDEVFDTVLVDAPCSGTGTLRRNPEIRYRLAPSDLKALKEKQLRLLKGASKLVRPDGCLIYSTCSLEIDENEAVVDEFLAEKMEFEIFGPEMARKLQDERGFIRTFPDTHGTDGFFVACLRRR